MDIVARIGAGPVITGEPGDFVVAAILIFVGVGFVEEVGDGVAGIGVFAIGFFVEVEVEDLGEVLVPCFGHAVGGRLAFSGEDVIDRVMGIFTHGEVIVAFIEEEGLRAVGVIGSKIAFFDIHGDYFTFPSSEEFRLAKADEIDRGFLYAMGNVIGGIGLLDVDLDRFFARDGAGVGDLDRDGVGMVSVFGRAEVAIREGSVA